MQESTLSNRLQLVASFLPTAANFADIGSDHAYLPCVVCARDPQAQAIAGEINEGPFQNARKTVEYYNLTHQIQVRKGDGLAVIAADEVNQITISGMGGTLITQILEHGKSKLGKANRIITQPNVDAISVRKWFDQNHYNLVIESILEEDGHIYEVLVADKNEQSSPYKEDDKQKQLLFGPHLLKQRTAPFFAKWKIEQEKRQLALSQMKKATMPDQDKIAHFESEISMIQEVLDDDSAR
ncbi:tRNA (adenine(22)-N(1))-methyltransferase [Radiobacillus sp. PE A8.2]|uniref:tRNA (adenine(22)-N(1))-methyltransferase n=1 Tax=Radiobacillus sp. PE A8.2 TaxID=3380349 RepID=UPI00388EA492